jgi:hypothetical protein
MSYSMHTAVHRTGALDDLFRSVRLPALVLHNLAMLSPLTWTVGYTAVRSAYLRRPPRAETRCRRRRAGRV